MARYEVVQWSTGNIGRRALGILLDRDDFDVVGAHAFGADKVGCDAGALADVIGSDPDPLALKRAQRKVKRLDGIRFEQGYAQRLPYRDGEFDRVLSSMMLHHLDSDAKPAAAAEIFRVLRPGGRLHLVDMGGNMSAHDGLAARLVRHSPHAAGNLGDAIPRLFRSAGFDRAELATERHRFVGRLTYYSATRPV